MNKTCIVISREFSTRVRKKTFLVTTILVPLLCIGLYAFMIWMMTKKDTQDRRIAVINGSALEQPVQKINNTDFIYPADTVSQEKASEYLTANNYYAILWIPADVMTNAEVVMHSFAQIPPSLESDIRAQLRSRIEGIKKAAVIQETGLPDLEQKLAATQTPVRIRTLKVLETGESKESSSTIASIVGVVAGMAIYIFILIYASQVMQGVIQEKTNRIIEVLVSSIKPFPFLMGKIIGVASVGLLQFVIWIVFGGVAVIALQSVLMPGVDLEALRNSADLAQMAQSSGIDMAQLETMKKIALTIDPGYILGFTTAFVFYFLGGYLLYASLFAAIGAAVDNETDSQQFMTPLSIVLVVAFYIGVAAMRNPETPIVFWASFVPFTSPIVMLVRMAFGVPAWEIFLSAAILGATFIFFTWVSSRIYRVGILMYGKKPTWKEMYKWLKY